MTAYGDLTLTTVPPAYTAAVGFSIGLHASDYQSTFYLA